MELTLEQQFNIAAFEEQVKELNQEQAQKMLIELYRQMLIKEVLYKDLLKQSLGVI